MESCQIHRWMSSNPVLKVLASDDEVPQVERAAEQSMAERFCVLFLHVLNF